MHGTRPHERPSASSRAVGAKRHEQPLDDWLGDVSDDDWSEQPTRAPSPQAGADAWAGTPRDDASPAHPEDRPEPARARDRAQARRTTIERRRYTAGLVLVVALALAVGIPVLLLRDGGETDATPVEDVAGTPTEGSASTSPTTTTTATTTTPSAAPSDTATTSPTSPSAATTTTTTAPSTSGASTFSLPEGTKLQRGEGDPALVKELQQALLAAGFDPGPADGTFGRGTEAAVVAFQQANGLSVDGRVGPETASALSAAIASG